MKLSLVTGALLVCSAAHAHLGAVITPAKFTTPPGPSVTRGNPTNTVAPFTFDSASSSYVVAWQDGDMDPTGRYTFYYLDHSAPYQVSVAAIEGGMGHLVHTADGINDSGGGYWISCSCTSGPGVACPDAGARDPNGNCANQLTWDLTGVADGSYWLVAVNHDPPLAAIWSLSDGPVRVAKSAALPPATVVIRPDGYGSYSQYRAQWIAVGAPPLRFDLFYFDGRDDDPSIVLKPPLPLAANVQPILNGDGSFSFDWDFTPLANNAYEYLRVRVSDGNGVQSYADSRFGVRVYRNAAAADLGVPGSGDMGAPAAKHSGCSIAPSGTTPPPLLLLLLLAAFAGRALTVACASVAASARRETSPPPCR